MTAQRYQVLNPSILPTQSRYCNSKQWPDVEILGVCAPRGSGKTTAAAAYTVSDVSVTAMAHRKTLVNQLATKFSATPYLDAGPAKVRRGVAKDAARYATTSHSGWLLDSRDMSEDTLVIDEFTQLMRDIGGHTEARRDVAALLSAIARARRVILLDADLQPRDLVQLAKYLRAAGHPARRMAFVVNTYTPKRGEAVELPNLEQLHQDLTAHVLEGGSAYMYATTRGGAEVALERLLSAGVPESDVLLVTANTAQSDRVRAYLDDPTGVGHPKVLIASPTMTTGYSLDMDAEGKPAFDRVFCHAEGMETVHPDDILQGIARVRGNPPISYVVRGAYGGGSDDLNARYAAELDKVNCTLKLVASLGEAPALDLRGDLLALVVQADARAQVARAWASGKPADVVERRLGLDGYAVVRSQGKGPKTDRKAQAARVARNVRLLLEGAALADQGSEDEWGFLTLGPQQRQQIIAAQTAATVLGVRRLRANTPGLFDYARSPLGFERRIRLAELLLAPDAARVALDTDAHETGARGHRATFAGSLEHRLGNRRLLANLIAALPLAPDAPAVPRTIAETIPLIRYSPAQLESGGVRQWLAGNPDLPRFTRCRPPGEGKSTRTIGTLARAAGLRQVEIERTKAGRVFGLEVAGWTQRVATARYSIRVADRFPRLEGMIKPIRGRSVRLGGSYRWGPRSWTQSKVRELSKRYMSPLRAPRTEPLPVTHPGVQAGLRCIDVEGLTSTLEQLKTSRTGEDLRRLRSTETALGKLAGGVTVSATTWTRERGGRWRTSHPPLQAVPRAVRQYLGSSIPGHHLIDLDLSGCHGTLSGRLSGCTGSAWVHTREGREAALEVIPGATLAQIKVAILGMMLGVGTRKLCRDVFPGLQVEHVLELIEWYARSAPGWTAHQREVRAAHPERWRKVLAHELRTAESDILDRILSRLGEVPGAQLVLPMFDGLLLSAHETEAAQVACAVEAIMREESGMNVHYAIAQHWPTN